MTEEEKCVCDQSTPDWRWIEGRGVDFSAVLLCDHGTVIDTYGRARIRRAIG